MNWENEASRILKAEVVRHGVTYRKLARRLADLNVRETERSIANKLSRGSFSFVFALQCLKALGVESLHVELPEELGTSGPLSSSTPQGAR